MKTLNWIFGVMIVCLLLLSPAFVMAEEKQEAKSLSIEVKGTALKVAAKNVPLAEFMKALDEKTGIKTTVDPEIGLLITATWYTPDYHEDLTRLLEGAGIRNIGAEYVEMEDNGKFKNFLIGLTLMKSAKLGGNNSLDVPMASIITTKHIKGETVVKLSKGNRMDEVPLEKVEIGRITDADGKEHTMYIMPMLPNRLRVDVNNNIYVFCTGSTGSRVYKYDASGKSLRTYEPKKGMTYFDVDADENMYFTNVQGEDNLEAKNGEINVLNKNGKLIMYDIGYHNIIVENGKIFKSREDGDGIRNLETNTNTEKRHRLLSVQYQVKGLKVVGGKRYFNFMHKYGEFKEKTIPVNFYIPVPDDDHNESPKVIAILGAYIYVYMPYSGKGSDAMHPTHSVAKYNYLTGAMKIFKIDEMDILTDDMKHWNPGESYPHFDIDLDGNMYYQYYNSDAVYVNKYDLREEK